MLMKLIIEEHKSAVMFATPSLGYKICTTNIFQTDIDKIFLYSNNSSYELEDRQKINLNDLEIVKIV